MKVQFLKNPPEIVRFAKEYTAGWITNREVLFIGNFPEKQTAWL